MKFVILILLFSAPFIYAEISDCTPEDSPVKLIKFEISPDPLEIGKEANISTTFITEKQVDKGEIDIKAYVKIGNNWIPMPKFGMNMCSIIDCPVKKGEQSVDKSFTIPGVVPKGEFRGVINVHDDKKNLLVCLNFQIEIK